MKTNGNNHYNILSVIDLLTPQEKKITLVPLKQVIETDSILIWGSVFWNIFALTLGSLIALMLISYSNNPVKYLLSLFALTFLFLGIFFTMHGLKIRQELKNDSESSQSLRQEMLMRKLNQLQTEALVYRFHRDLGAKVFKNSSELKVADFNKNFGELLAPELDENLQKELVNRMIQDGMISIDKRNGAGSIFKYNQEFIFSHK